MTTIGFHASHEQISPGQLLTDVQHAEQAGFAAAMCSDHFAPWSARQGQSGFAWSWLGAALATTKLPFGMVNAPGQRYHPAIIAQAISTLAGMFPGRFWAALGSGEAANEHITGDVWPPKEQRNQRLLECVDVIRRLLAGEEVTHDGLVTVDRARVWERPDPVPLLVAPAASVESAARVAAWADGLVTLNQPVETLRELLLANHGGEPDPAAVAALSGSARLVVAFDADGSARLEPAEGGVDGVIAGLLGIVARSQAEGTWSRLKACPATTCRWAFYDHSRNHSRTWCTMSLCGNREKARNYRARQR